MSLRLIAKLGLLLVVIGFFMPIACDQNGAQLADYLIKNDNAIEGVLFYLMLISAIVGVLIGVSLLMNKRPSSGIDWLAIIVCIASGLIVYFRLLKEGPELQSGAYVILIGWIIAFGGQILSGVKKE